MKRYFKMQILGGTAWHFESRHDAQYLAIRSKCLNHNMQSRHITAPFGCNMSCYIQKKAGNQSMPTENALLGSFDTCVSKSRVKRNLGAGHRYTKSPALGDLIITN